MLSILLLISIIACVQAYVQVVSVIMPILASSHAIKLTQTINYYENTGCVLFNSDTYNDATYLYFRCKD
jgi:hypothetical protein